MAESQVNKDTKHGVRVYMIQQLMKKHGVKIDNLTPDEQFMLDFKVAQILSSMVETLGRTKSTQKNDNEVNVGIGRYNVYTYIYIFVWK